MSNNNESSSIILTPEQIDAWVASYEATGKLPSPKIPCSTGSGVMTTMFGDNLHKRVLKFGGIRNLLETFEARDARAKKKAEATLAKIAAKSAVVTE